MNPLRVIAARLRGWIRRNAIADEIREELTTHFESRVAQYEREGLSRSEAERRARERVGNLTLHHDRGYDVRGGGMVEVFMRDLSAAWRSVRGRGWRAAFAVVLLGLTLAANAVVFSAADAFVFRTVPYTDPESLVVIQKTARLVGASDYVWRDWVLAFRKQSDLFSGIEGHDTGGGVVLTFDGVSESVRSQRVTPGLFPLLGVMPAHGRPFTDADAVKGAPRVAIIGDRLARRLFSDPQVAVGRTFEDQGNPVTVVGVMPATFRFPTAVEEIWRPVSLESWPDRTGIRHVARLARGQNVERAAAAVAARLPVVLGPEADRLKREPMALVSLADFRSSDRARGVFGVLLAAAVCLLLIACANVASLELASTGQRLRVWAIQTALGASRGSLVRVAMLETLLLLMAAVAAGIGCAWWGNTLLTTQLTVAMRDALANPLDLDGRAIGFMAAVALVTGILTLLPLLFRVSSVDVVAGFRDDPRTMPASRRAARLRQLLMTGQVALTVVLLVGAFLYMRSYEARVSRETGMDLGRVVTVAVYPSQELVSRATELADELLARLRSAPFVVSVAGTDTLPPSTASGMLGNLTIEGSAASVAMTMLSVYGVDPEYFPTLGIQIVSGRAFDASSPREAVIVDEAFARQYWPNGNAVGSRFSMGSVSIRGVKQFEIVGVSRQLRADRATTATGDNVFVTYLRILREEHGPVTSFVAKLDRTDNVEALGAMVRSLSGRSIVRIDTLEARYARLEGDTRLTAAITTGFGTIALVVAIGGIYAVMAFLVAGRSREIGIRMALGADCGNIRRLIFSSSRFVVSGALLGLAGAAILSRAVVSQLYGVGPTDPLSYGGVTAIVLITAIVATWWPARRASRVDPAVILRRE